MTLHVVRWAIISLGGLKIRRSYRMKVLVSTSSHTLKQNDVAQELGRTYISGDMMM